MGVRQTWSDGVVEGGGVIGGGCWGSTSGVA